MEKCTFIKKYDIGMKTGRWISIYLSLVMPYDPSAVRRRTADGSYDQVRRWQHNPYIRTSGGRPNQWPQQISVASAQLHQQQKTDGVSGQIYSNTFHARYSRAPLTSTIENGWQRTTARKEAKCVRSDASHPSHFHTTLQQYRGKSAATQ